MNLRKLFLIICTICFTVALACVAVACGEGGDGDGETIHVVSVELNKNELSLFVGGEETLEAKINPRNATDLSVSWKSSEPSVATVDNGTVKALAVGETIITVTASGKEASCKVTVTEKQVIHVNSVTLTQHNIEMLVNGTYTNLLTTILPANATETEVTWTSSDPDCVTVTNKGHLKAVAVGTAVITAEVDGKSDKCTVTVSDVADSIELSEEEVEIVLGGNKTITATVKPEEKSFVVVWTSSNNNIATVEDGTITAVAQGTATITAKAGGKSATCKVTVTTVNVNSISLDKKELALTVGDTDTLKATVDPEEAASAIIWESSDKNVATVVGGVVTAVNPGSATITATVGGKSASCEVTVSASIADNSIVTYAHAGEESAAFEWKDNNAKGAKVEYKLSSANSYTSIDSQLIRQISTGIVRADILGLKGGAKYDFKITSSSNQIVYALSVDIAKLDRSGYAHSNLSGVGAYNDDGTLKSNAVVIYLTEDNKNNVKDGKSIAEYLSKKNSTPIVIRVIGTVGSATWNDLEYNAPDKIGDDITADKVVGINGKRLPQQASTQQELIDGGYNTLNLRPYTEKGIYDNRDCDPIRGLNSKATYDSDKDEYDSCWNDCTVNEMSNVTIEGVGEDAEIFQWGFTFKKCNSIEVRNLRFYDYTEDACSFEGSENSTTLSGFKHSNFWVHHNIFDLGVNHWDICAEQDKHDGDGATDFKKLSYVTVAYNQYNYTHKTGLVGGGDTHYQACFTFHHNYYNGCDQRMPLGRQANMHLYNNYYSTSGLYSVSLRASAYAFIENCVFTSKYKTGSNPTKPIELVKGSAGTPSAKVIDCEIEGSIANAVGSDYLYVGNDRSATVKGDNLYGLNFDTKSGFYTVTDKLETSKVASEIPKLAGTLKRLSNIVIDGSSQGGDSGNSGGTDTPNPNPGDDTEKSKLTFTVDAAVAAGKLQVGSNNCTDKELADGIKLTSSNATVSTNSKDFEDGTSFEYRMLLGKRSGGERYFTITTSGAATIKVYAINTNSSDNDRAIGLYKDTGANNLVDGTYAITVEASTAKIVSISVSKGGTYYLIVTVGDLNICAIDIVESSGGDSGNTGTKAEQSISYTEANNESTVSGQFASGDLFTATANASATVTKDASTATTEDQSKSFDYGLFPGSTGFTVTVKANKSITLTIYYTISNSNFASTNQSKGGNLVWTIDGNQQTSTNTGNKDNKIAYCDVITLEAGKEVVFSIDSSSNRLVLFGLFAVEQ